MKQQLISVLVPLVPDQSLRTRIWKRPSGTTSRKSATCWTKVTLGCGHGNQELCADFAPLCAAFPRPRDPSVPVLIS